MTIRAAMPAVLACAFAALPAAAGPTASETLAVPVARTAGTCPAVLRLEIATTRYEGGYTLDVTARTMSAAYVAELLSATPKRIRFAAALRPAYASCRGSGRSKDASYVFVLRGGRLSYVVTPGKGPNGTPPGLRDVSVEGTPHVKLAFTD